MPVPTPERMQSTVYDYYSRIEGFYESLRESEADNWRVPPTLNGQWFPLAFTGYGKVSHDTHEFDFDRIPLAEAFGEVAGGIRIAFFAGREQCDLSHFQTGHGTSSRYHKNVLKWYYLAEVMAKFATCCEREVTGAVTEAHHLSVADIANLKKYVIGEIKQPNANSFRSRLSSLFSRNPSANSEEEAGVFQELNNDSELTRQLIYVCNAIVSVTKTIMGLNAAGKLQAAKKGVISDYESRDRTPKVKQPPPSESPRSQRPPFSSRSQRPPPSAQPPRPRSSSEPVAKSDFAEAVNIPSSSTKDDFKKAWRKFTMTNHPDKGGDENVFKEVLELKLKCEKAIGNF